MDLKLITLLCICLTAAVMDLITLKIKNSLIVAGIVSGFGFSFSEGGVHSLSLSLLGACIPVMLFFIPFMLRLFGAGDVKLFSMIGVFTGPKDIFCIILYSFLAGGLICIIRYMVTFREKGSVRIPFALPAFIGVLIMTGDLL
ncbi:MAG: prepilin peptidase [Lachnospiraceae bacterium]|nr:prepilin peptidase [Lachnospiraceae bacterium]